MINNTRSQHAVTFITLRWCRSSVTVSGRKTDGWLNTSQSRLIRLHRVSVAGSWPLDCPASSLRSLSGVFNTAPHMGWISTVGSENGWWKIEQMVVGLSPRNAGLLIVHIYLMPLFLFFFFFFFLFFLRLLCHLLAFLLLLLSPPLPVCQPNVTLQPLKREAHVHLRCTSKKPRSR